jgi:hypothetical protein
MTELFAQLPALQVVLPLLAAVLITFVRHEAFSFLVTLIVCLMLPSISGAMLLEVLANGPISYALERDCAFARVGYCRNFGALRLS